MDLGFRKPLVADDLWDLSRRDEAEGLVDSFQRNMEATIEPIKSPQVIACMSCDDVKCLGQCLLQSGLSQ